MQSKTSPAPTAVSVAAGGRRYTEALERDTKAQKDEISHLRESLDKATDRSSIAEQRLGAKSEEAASLSLRLGSATAESQALTDASRRTESWVVSLQNEKAALQAEKAQLQADRTSVNEQIVALRVEIGQLELRSAVALTERDATEQRLQQVIKQTTAESERLQARVATTEARCHELDSAHDRLLIEHERCKTELADERDSAKALKVRAAGADERVQTLHAEKEGLFERLRAAESDHNVSQKQHADAMQLQKDEYEEQLRQLLARHGEGQSKLSAECDAANARNAQASEQLAALKTRHEQVAEKLQRLTQDKNEMEMSSAITAERLQSRVAIAEETSRRVIAELDAARTELARLQAALGAASAIGDGREVLLETVKDIEPQMKALLDSKALLELRTERADERLATLLTERDEAHERQAKLSEQGELARAEVARLEAALKTLEESNKEQCAQLLSRAEFAERTAAQLKELRDAAVDGSRGLQEQLYAAQESRLSLTEQLHVAQAERRAADEARREADARKADASCAAQRCTDERNAAQLASAAAVAEKALLEDLGSRLESQVRELQAQMNESEQRAAAASAKADTYERRWDELGAESARKIDEARQEKLSLLAELAAAHAESGVNAERARQLEQRLCAASAEQAAMATRADVAEQQRLTSLRERDCASAERRSMEVELRSLEARYEKTATIIPHLEGSISRLAEEKATISGQAGANEAALLQRALGAEERYNGALIDLVLHMADGAVPHHLAGSAWEAASARARSAVSNGKLNPALVLEQRQQVSAARARGMDASLCPPQVSPDAGSLSAATILEQHQSSTRQAAALARIAQTPAPSSKRATAYIPGAPATKGTPRTYIPP